MGEDAVGGIPWGDGGVPTRDTGPYIHTCIYVHVYM